VPLIPPPGTFSLPDFGVAQRKQEEEGKQLMLFCAMRREEWLVGVRHLVPGLFQAALMFV